MSGIEQSKVDNSTQRFLDEIEDTTDYNKWYCGHYYTNEVVYKLKIDYPAK